MMSYGQLSWKYALVRFSSVPAALGRFRQRGRNAKTNWALNSASGLIDHRFSHEELLLAIPHSYDDQ